MSTPDGSAVTIAVLTYRRPADLPYMLAELLAEIERSAPAASVLVVDNDADQSARPVVEALAGRGVAYVAEPTPGIAAARNRALRTVTRDFLIFIDDDEHPRPGWLAALLDTQVSAAADAVAGPVLSEFETPLDDWIAAGRFFQRLRHRTGTVLSMAATNNLLLDLRTVRRLGLSFDERFGLSGGSDTLFTRQLTGGGGRLVWCDEAVVVDRVPAARATRAWVLQRAFRTGNSSSRVEVALAAPGRARLQARCTATGRGVLRTAGGAARMVLGRLRRSEAEYARGLRSLRRGNGMIAGAWGGVYSEYHRS